MHSLYEAIGEDVPKLRLHTQWLQTRWTCCKWLQVPLDPCCPGTLGPKYLLIVMNAQTCVPGMRIQNSTTTTCLRHTGVMLPLTDGSISCHALWLQDAQYLRALILHLCMPCRRCSSFSIFHKR